MIHNGNKTLEDRIKAIEVRNKRVEIDKAWEVSLARRICISVLTYIVVVGYLSLINNDQPLINGLVPAAGYLLSTLVMKNVRFMWQKRRLHE